VDWNERNTLAQVLADAGYHCINVGWRNMHPTRKLFGFHTVICHDLREGADDYMDWLREHLGPEACERAHGCDANGWLGRPWPYEERFHPTVWTTDVTLRQIKRRDPTRPFFVWCSHMRPHSPYDPPQFFWDMYINKKLPEIPIGDWAASGALRHGARGRSHDIPQPGLDRTAWRGRLTPEQNHRMRAAYMGVCTHIDYELGRLMEDLARSENLLRDTLILFTSDHGDMMGDHHLHRKTYAYEGSARIPMLISYPAWLKMPSGKFQNVVGLQDVMPTLLEAAGVPIPASVTGKSLFDAIKGEPWREFLHGEHSPCYSPEEAMHYLTDGKEKYIWFPATGQEQFFDLVKDRQELHDLAPEARQPRAEAENPNCASRVALWRQRLIELLGKRGDGFSDGKKLLIRKDRWSAVVGR
jgi:arylsulfatase A-like enzyme